MIAKTFEFSGRFHLELNLSTWESARFVDLLEHIVPSTLTPYEKTIFTKLMNAIERGWKAKNHGNQCSTLPK